MGMRIRTNVSSLTAQRHMDKNNQDMSGSLEKLSSGYRINKSSDDAAGLAITENLRGQIRGMNVARRNANDAISLVQVAEGSMNEMSNIMIRLRARMLWMERPTPPAHFEICAQSPSVS